MTQEPFDSFELEKIQLRLAMKKKARALLESGKNLSEVAKIMKADRYRISYDQLREMVESGELPDNFKKAQELVKELCTKQGLDVDEIAKILREKKLSYPKPWIGRWISENDWKCEVKPEISSDVPLALSNVLPSEMPSAPILESPDAAATPQSAVETVLPVPEPPKAPIEEIVSELKVNQGTAMRLLQKMTGRNLTNQDKTIPIEWVAPIKNTQFIPLQMVNTLFGSDLTEVIQKYIDFVQREENKVTTAVRILEKMTGTKVGTKDFIKAITRKIKNTGFIPLELVNNLLNIDGPHKGQLLEMVQKMQNAMGILDDAEKLDQRAARANELAELLEKRRGEFIYAGSSSGKGFIKPTDASANTLSSFWDKVETVEDAQKLFAHLLGTFKIITFGDVIRLPLGPWPDENTLDLLMDVWSESRFKLRGQEAMSIVGDLEDDDKKGLGADTKMVFVPALPSENADFSRFRQVLTDWYDNTATIYPRDIYSWLLILHVVMAIGGDAVRRQKPVTITRAQILFKNFKLETVANLLKQFSKIGALTEVDVLVGDDKGLGYIPNDAKISRKINDLYIYLKNEKLYSIRDRNNLIFTLESDMAGLATGPHRLYSLSDLLKELPGPNEACFCGSKKKFKKCHKAWF